MYLLCHPIEQPGNLDYSGTARIRPPLDCRIAAPRKEARKDFMGSGAPFTFRIPLILLAIANLAVLGMRLWPWQQVVLNLPLNGATGIDPAVCLLTYVFMLFWIAVSQSRVTQKAL